MHESEKSIESLLLSGDFQNSEKLCVNILKNSPIIAQLWVYLAEALMQQGFVAAARKTFNRAWLLDPEAAWVSAVQAAMAKQVDNGKVRPDIDELLEVRKVTITAAILAKNEARCIERCLSHLQGAVDEIVLIDTGSTDRTLEIAARFPNVRIVHVPWRDDFAAARNEGLKQITTDWVLWIDADEYLHEDDTPHVRELAGLFDRLQTPVVLNIGQLNSKRGSVSANYSNPRMFPLRWGLRYWGRVHEQVGGTDGGMFGSSIYRCSVRIRVHHDGYEPTIVQQKDKLQRNLILLRKMVEEEPDNPGWWLFYGRETLSSGDVEQAIPILTTAEQKAAHEPRFGRTLDIQMLLVKAHLSQNNLEQAEVVCRRTLENTPNFPDAMFYLAQIQMKQAHELHRQAEQNLRKLKEAAVTYRGTVSADSHIVEWKADLALAEIAYKAGKLAPARRLFRSLASRYPNLPDSRKRLEQIEEQRMQLNQNER